MCVRKSMSVRVAVIGAGIMGADHAGIIAGDIPGAVVQVVCDADGDRARAIADTCGAQDAATDPLAAIARPDVDAVLIATPDHLHEEQALAVLAAGKPCLCEKPLADDQDACRRVLTAEAAAGTPLIQVGFMRRFDPAYVDMRASGADGTLGRPLVMHNFHRNVASPGDWFTAEMAISNSACHEFDIARFVLGTDFVSVASWQPQRSDEAVAPVMMVLETAGGHLVNIEVNNSAAYGYDVRGELVGERGSFGFGAPVQSRYDLESASTTPYPLDWRPRFADAYRHQNKAWIAAINSGEPCRTAASAWDGYCAAVVADAAVDALRSGQRVAVPQPDMPDFYRRLMEAS